MNATANERSTARDKISNGTRILPVGVDMRTATGRRLKYLIRSFHEALGGGDISEIELAQLRQVATLTLKAEQVSAALVRGESIDADQLIRINSEIRRILQQLGVKAAAQKSAAPTNLAELLGEVDA